MPIDQPVRLPGVSRRQHLTGFGQGEAPEIPPGTAVIKHAEKLAEKHSELRKRRSQFSQHAGLARGPVLPGCASFGAGAHGPGEFVDARGSLDALDAEPGAKATGAQVLDEGHEVRWKRWRCSGARRSRSAVKWGRTS